MNLLSFKRSIGVAILASLASCQQPNNQPAQSSLSKEDSIAIARSVAEKYPDALNRSSRRMTDSVSARSLAAGEIIPPAIKWEEVITHTEKYDENPAMRDANGNAIKGFLVNGETYQYLLDNEAIKGLYIRMAKKENGEYTVLLMGTTDTGTLLVTSTEQEESGKFANFNYLGSCPSNCPTNFDNE